MRANEGRYPIYLKKLLRQALLRQADFKKIIAPSLPFRVDQALIPIQKAKAHKVSSKDQCFAKLRTQITSQVYKNHDFLNRAREMSLSC